MSTASTVADNSRPPRLFQRTSCPTAAPISAVPIGVNLDNHARREELRKRAKEYIHALTAEPQYAEQVTDSVRHTGLPRKILTMAQRFAQRTDVSHSPPGTECRRPLAVCLVVGANN